MVDKVRDQLPACDTGRYNSTHVQDTLALLVSSLEDSELDNFRTVLHKVVKANQGEAALQNFITEQSEEWSQIAHLLGVDAPHYPYSVSDFANIEQSSAIKTEALKKWVLLTDFRRGK